MKAFRTYVLLLVTGAILGSFCDGFHTRSGTTLYSDPWRWQMAWWTPLVFGLGFLGMAISQPKLDGIFRRGRSSPNWRSIILGMSVFFLAYFLSGFWKVDSIIKSGVLGLVWFSLWIIFDRSLSGVIQSLTSAVAGCGVEIYLIKAGGFVYLQPDYWGVPYWLPCLYAAASIAIGNVGRRILAPIVPE